MHVKALGLGLILVAGAAAAQQQVAENPVVKARMELMQTVRVNTGILGDMASGKAAFDATKAAEAKAALTEAAAGIGPHFQAQESDPASKSKPEIWANWDDYLAKAKVLEDAANALDASSVDTLKAGMGAVGGTCRECHSAYRL